MNVFLQKKNVQLLIIEKFSKLNWALVLQTFIQILWSCWMHCIWYIGWLGKELCPGSLANVPMWKKKLIFSMNLLYKVILLLIRQITICSLFKVLFIRYIKLWYFSQQTKIDHFTAHQISDVTSTSKYYTIRLQMKYWYSVVTGKSQPSGPPFRG